MVFNAENFEGGENPEDSVVRGDQQNQEGTTALGLEEQREKAAFWVTQWNEEPRYACPV